MTRQKPKNLAASISTRLLNLRSQLKRDHQQLLVRFANERVLYRLSISPHVDQFILKGAMMLNVWLHEPHRATRDIDVLGKRELNKNDMKTALAEILAIDADDALTFDLDSITTDDIREDTEYGGLRLRFNGRLGTSKLSLSIDIGFGDAVVPAPTSREIPVLLDFPAPTLLTYAPETSVAEKFHAIVKHGATNSRVKDYGDIWVLRDSCDPQLLAKAIAATFERRDTTIPTELPDGLKPEYANDQTRVAQWNVERQQLLHRPDSFQQLIEDVGNFIMPHAEAARALASDAASR